VTATAIRARTPRSRCACAQRSLGARALTAVLLVTMFQGCSELYRWPERMDSPAVRRQEQIPADGRYTIQPGDTVYSIAFRYKLNFRELAEWNGIGSDYLIRPGEVIRLSPPPGGAAARAPIPARPPATAPAGPAPPRERLPPPEVTTAIAWQWPTAGAVAKPFSDGGKGIDIGGALGQPVLAAGAGKVVYSGSALKGYGELIIIKHDDVHLSAYGYNRRRLVDEGATVKAGQPIAELGLGPEQKPVLHFEIRKRGRPVDPASYLPPR
jgi:lipoprotein NlpD